MSSNQDIPDVTTPNTREPNATDPAAAAPASEIVAMATISPGLAIPAADNDNSTPGGIPDTTPLLARPEVVRSIRTALRVYGIRSRDMADAIAEVQTKSLEAARTGKMPRSVAQWKALATKIAINWALDRYREAKVRKKYNAGLCEDPDAYMAPTLHWEHRDPVDTKRYLAILKELFDSGQMPEDGAEILMGEADGVSHAELARELGLSETVVDNRLFRMRARFRARLAALGILTLLVLVYCAVLAPVADVAAPRPPNLPDAAPDAAAWEAGR